MNKYPDYKTYQALYKRFYNGRGPEELIALAGPLEGKTVLDLCAGDGRLAIETVRLGAKQACLIEQEKEMTSKELRNSLYTAPNPLRPTLFVYTGGVVQVLSIFKKEYFDVAFCQQGVNYWLNEDTAQLATGVLKTDGLFIFNTFSQKPPEKPMVKEYELDGKKFVEVSWLVGDVVRHVQIREGMEPHETEFKWLSPEYLETILQPYFSKVEVINDGKTALYRCSK